MAQTVVKINSLVKRYKELIAVDHFDLEIKQGEVFGLLGPNGSGKTTTINCLLSLLDFDKGEIEIFGEKMTPTNYALKKRIGVISQNVAVYDELTVYENIDYFCGLYITDKATRKKYVDDAVKFVGLEEFLKFRPKKLSGGLLRRLNIACGIAHKPELIILDEPTVAVDPQSRNKILEGILELNAQGATIIYTSHYMEEVEQICTRIAIMDKGKNIALGTKAELKKMIRNTETVSIETGRRDFRKNERPAARLRRRLQGRQALRLLLGRQAQPAQDTRRSAGKGYPLRQSLFRASDPQRRVPRNYRQTAQRQ